MGVRCEGVQKATAKPSGKLNAGAEKQTKSAVAPAPFGISIVDFRCRKNNQFYYKSTYMGVRCEGVQRATAKPSGELNAGAEKQTKSAVAPAPFGFP